MAPSGAEQHWVAVDGDDAAAGTEDAPWATLQHAVDGATPGSTVLVRDGVYAQQVDVTVSGTPGRPVVIRNAPGEHPVLDGSSLEVGQSFDSMISIEDQRYVEIRGFEIRGLRTDVSGHNPVGILVTGASDHVTIAGNSVHDLGSTYQGRVGGDAHGIAVYGNLADHPIDDVAISGNELYDLALGSSEALVVNGNVTGFAIEGNLVHDTNNIAIVAIGYEGTAPDPSVDSARTGIIRGNTVYNVDSYGNPAYGTDRSADGIYVDGGRDVLVEGNVVHDVNIGMEFASEHHGRSTSFVTARNNLVYGATAIGIAIGGYDRRRGSTEGAVIVNNTVVGYRRRLAARAVRHAGQRDPEQHLRGRSDRRVRGESVRRERRQRRRSQPVSGRRRARTGACGSGRMRATRTSPPGRARSGVDEHSAFADPGFVDPSAEDYPADGRLAGGRRRRVRGPERSRRPAGRAPAAGGRHRPGGLRADRAAGTPDALAVGPRRLSQRPDMVERDQRLGAGGARPQQRRAGVRRRERLTIGTATYDRGIGAHAPSRVVIDLEQPCSLFLADVGLDEEVGDRGSVEFRVLGDGEMLVSSGVLRGPQISAPIAADLSGVEQLELIVTPGGDGRSYDHADWGDARLSC